MTATRLCWVIAHQKNTSSLPSLNARFCAKIALVPQQRKINEKKLGIYTFLFNKRKTAKDEGRPFLFQKYLFYSILSYVPFRPSSKLLLKVYFFNCINCLPSTTGKQPWFQFLTLPAPMLFLIQILLNISTNSSIVIIRDSKLYSRKKSNVPFRAEWVN